MPIALGDFLVLQAIRESGGIALTVTDEQMLEGCRLIGRTTGLFTAPETGAAMAGFQELLARKWLDNHETVVLFNTGTGLKYSQCFK